MKYAARGSILNPASIVALTYFSGCSPLYM